MLGWWVAWLVSMVPGQVSGRLTKFDNSLATLRNEMAHGLVSEVATVIAAVTCAWIVRSIAQRVRAGGYRRA